MCTIIQSSFPVTDVPPTPGCVANRLGFEHLLRHRFNSLVDGMSRNEILTPSLLRMDGRRPFEFRSMEVHLTVHQAQASGSSGLASTSSNTTTEQPDGSARLVQGLNDVTCSVFGPRESTSSSRGGVSSSGLTQEGASVEFDLMSENWSNIGQERRNARRGDRRTQETISTLSAVFAPLISTQLFPRSSSILVSLVVSSSDGSLLSTLINAATLALVDAGIPLKDYCLATSLSFHPPVRGNDILLLDPTSSEENDLPTLTLAVTPRDGKVCLSALDSGRGKMDGHRIAGAIEVGAEVLSGRLLEEVETSVKGWAKGLRDVAAR
ncbi:unnamed protein product [Parajaminaea phylloscopi]